MDRKPPQDPRLDRLVLQAAAARSHLSREVVVLKHRLDVPARLKSSLQSHSLGWILGSAASGLAASLLFRRGRATPPKTHRSFPLAAAGLVLTAARPLLKVWLTDQVRHYLGNPGRPSASGFRTPSSR